MATKRVEPKEYDRRPSNPCRVVVIEVVLRDNEDRDDAIERALDAAREYGAAEITENFSIANSFEEACSILYTRRFRDV